MKTIITFYSFFLPFIVFSQINVIEKSEPVIIGKVQFIKLEKTDNIYTFTYDNIKYKTISDTKSFSFEDKENAFEKLYQLIIDGFENLPNNDIMIDLPNDIIWLHFEKNLGLVSFQFRQAINKSDVFAYSVYLTKKQVQKLFGKI